MMNKIRKITILLALIIIAVSALSAQVPEVSAYFKSIESTLTRMKTGDSDIIEVVYQIPENQYQGWEERMFTIELLPGSPFTLGELTYPEGRMKDDLRIFEGKTIISAPLTANLDIEPGEYTILVKAKYQLCDYQDGTCFFPGSEELELTVNIEEASVAAPSDSSLNLNKNSGTMNILWFLLLALVGGLLLNVMPCVLPVLSLKALSLVHQSENNKKEILLGGWLYAAGIISSLFVFATVITIIKLSGERVGWGFQFQNTGFVISLISIIFLFALSLFEVFIITMPGMNKAAGLSGKKGGMGSFLSGVFAVLLATPCTAPFLGTALGFAFSQPPIIIYLIFFFVGLGLSLPFLLLGFFPGIVKALPKPGNWMNIFRETMGFLLIATVLWLFTVLYKQIGGAGLVDVLIFLFSLTIAAWIFGRWGNPSKKKQLRIIASILALVIIVASAVVLFNPDGKKTENLADGIPIPAGWEPFNPDLLLEDVNRGTPVFLAFSAQWCLTCKTNERTTLLTKWGHDFFTSRGITRYYGDYTNEDPVIAEWIENFGRAGVPVYIYFPPEGDPILLPEVINRGLLEEKIKI
ncbi:MAG: thioredoxin family protein [Spirochaetales bacterium]|nr:thioredoxin family protein [Spirochaetales bacterium]